MWHSERNGSATEPMRFLQFWILPDTPNLEPSVQQRSFSEDERTNQLLRVAGPRPDDPVLIHQDASVHVGLLDPGVEETHSLGVGPIENDGGVWPEGSGVWAPVTRTA